MSRRTELANFMLANKVIVYGDIQLSSGIQSDYDIDMSKAETLPWHIHKSVQPQA